MKQSHNDKIEKLQQNVRRFYDSKTKVKIYHGSSNSTRAVEFDKDKMVDVSQFDEIIEINVDKKYAIVETNVALDKLLDATLKFGLIPLVVSEFPGITVGGAVQGGAGESSSFKWGCLHETCKEYEIVTATGEVVTATPNENSDLFYGMPCSYGSQGVLTTITLQLVPTTDNIKLEYIRVSSYSEALEIIQTKINTAVEFIDAIMFTPSEGVVMVGNFTDDSRLKLTTFHKTTDEWFSIHAENVINKHSIHNEAIPIKDYLFRYDRGAFWVGKCGFNIFNVPFNRLTRVWFANLMKTRTLYRFLHGSNISQQFVIQDVCLPVGGVLPFLSYMDANCGIYPLWLCPLKPDENHLLSPTYIDTDLVVNIGVWGQLRSSHLDIIEENRKMERKVSDLGGRKVLYAQTYYTSDEFWHSYDKKVYDKLRYRYEAATIFPNIYDKIVVKKQLQPSLFKGWLSLIKPPFGF